MDFIIARFIKMIRESYGLKCEYTRDDPEEGILIISNLDYDTKKFIMGITFNTVTSIITELDDKTKAVVKKIYKREDKHIAHDYGLDTVCIVFTDDNYAMKVNALDARFREYFTSEKKTSEFLRKANSL